MGIHKSTINSITVDTEWEHIMELTERIAHLKTYKHDYDTGLLEAQLQEYTDSYNLAKQPPI